MPSHERTPQERETLIFSNPEAAQAFRERVEGRLSHDQRSGVGRSRELVAEEVAAEFAKEGEAVASLRQPWEHTPQEHHEVQQLVNVAFAKDLKAALTQARQSESYPRNLDLLHDVLTGEMYKLISDQRVNKQPTAIWALAITGIVILVVFLSILVFLAP